MAETYIVLYNLMKYETLQDNFLSILTLKIEHFMAYDRQQYHNLSILICSYIMKLILKDQLVARFDFRHKKQANVILTEVKYWHKSIMIHIILSHKSLDMIISYH